MQLTENLEVSKSTFVTLAIETWRLSRLIESSEGQLRLVALRYSIRKMKTTLESQGCCFIDLTGQLYDLGMAVEVIDSEDCQKEDKGSLIIKEMIAPIVLFNNSLLAAGQVIVGKLLK
ncbi:MAG: hypothetical protein WAQ98_26230 [Blastocatellia bacterium]